jgi:hypothetical protein
MNKPKADLLNKSINDPYATTEEKERLTKALNKHLQEREYYKLNTIMAFKNNYNFSKLYFINDYDIKKLNGGQKSGLFLNDNGIIDPNISMNEDFYLILGRKNNDETWAFIDPSGESLPTEFPVTYNKSILSILKAVFGSNSLNEFITGINKKLHSFYSKKN